MLRKQATGAPIVAPLATWQWDHLVPLTRGGPDGFDNLVRACARCNTSKGARFVTAWATENRVHLPRWVRSRHLKLLLDAAEATGRMDEPVESTAKVTFEAALFPGPNG